MSAWPTSMILADGSQVAITAVNDDAGLAAALAKIDRQLPLIFDSEFIRERTLYPLLGLFQLCQNEQVVLIDALAIRNWQPFKELLEADDAPLLVCHACGEDLEALQSRLDIVPKRLIDSQQAASFAGIAHFPGYGRLVEATLGLVLAKEHARTDWLARPLSPAQLNYAVADVVFLERLWPQLVATLEQRGLYQACLEECARLVAERTTRMDDNQRYLQVGNAWQLKPRQLAVLRELAAWRQQVARHEDKPLGHVLKEEPLLLLARQRWANRQALEQLDWLPKPLLRRHGDNLWAAIERGQNCSEAKLPPPLRNLLIEPGYKAAIRWCRAQANAAGQALAIAPELVASKRLVHELLEALDAPSDKQPVLLRGWRAPFFLPKLDELRQIWNQD